MVLNRQQRPCPVVPNNAIALTDPNNTAGPQMNVTHHLNPPSLVGIQTKKALEAEIADLEANFELVHPQRFD